MPSWPKPASTEGPGRPSSSSALEARERVTGVARVNDLYYTDFYGVAGTFFMSNVLS